MLKNLIALEHKIGEKVFKFITEGEVTWGEVHDALHAMKDFVVKQIVSMQASETPSQDETPKECA